MGPTARVVVALMAGLALSTWLAATAVDRVTRGWFERDLARSAEATATAARQALLSAWRSEDHEPLRAVLRDLVADERVLSASACAADGTLLASTRTDTVTLTCEGPARADGGLPAAPDVARSFVLAGDQDQRLHVTQVPVAQGSDRLGYLVLVHDARYIVQRRHQILWLVVGSFAVLAVAFGAATTLAARLARDDWARQLVRLVRGDAPRTEFRRVGRDVQELLRRLSDEAQADAQGGRWTPERLKRTLATDLHGGRVVILANREPYLHEYDAKGAVVVRHPASGLVTALEPVMRACSGVWVAHGSGSADRAMVDANGRTRVPPGEESYVLRRVWLAAEEERGYYYGLANEGLWPLCHVAHTRPVFRGSDWDHYRTVNQRFADAVCAEADGDDPVVLVQDYHFALVPRMIRARLPRATVIGFWHIPWPNAERLAMCPWKDDLLRGMLGSSIMGFHTQLHCNNFLEAIDRFLEARIDREQFAVVHEGRTTLVRPYPISIEWPNHWAEAAPDAAQCRSEVLDELGLPRGLRLGVGVDRLDYTKGIEERLLAVERLLEHHPELRGRFTFVQLAAPSRDSIEEYRQVAERVGQLVTRINERFGRRGWSPIVFRRAHHEPSAVFRYYRAADLCYVSSLHDGMNLVAKEFVAARDDEQGVLVLSTFTGAARELTEALIVNPYDLDEASDALAAALDMPPSEQRDRMRVMRSVVSEFNVYRWAGRMLIDAARLRQREQVSGRWRVRRSTPLVQMP